MSGRNLTDADIEALKVALLPVLIEAIEERLAERFYATAGRGLVGWVKKLWQPILVAAILYGLAIAPNLPKTIAEALHAPK